MMCGDHVASLPTRSDLEVFPQKDTSPFSLWHVPVMQNTINLSHKIIMSIIAMSANKASRCQMMTIRIQRRTLFTDWICCELTRSFNKQNLIKSLFLHKE